MSQNRYQYQYQHQKISNTLKNVSRPTQFNYSVKTNQVIPINTTGGFKGKIDIEFLKSKNVEFYRCPKCGKLKYRINEKQTTSEAGSWSKKSNFSQVEKTTKMRSITEDKKYEKYSKYNKASQTICKCGKVKTKCICKKKDKSNSVTTTTTTKRSSNVTRKVDLTPKIKVHLDQNKIKKAVEEQKRIAEEERKKMEERRKQRNIKTEEKKIRNYSKET